MAPSAGGQKRPEAPVLSKLKQFRAVATRYDKREFTYQGTIDVATPSHGLRV